MNRRQATARRQLAFLRAVAVAVAIAIAIAVAVARKRMATGMRGSSTDSKFLKPLPVTGVGDAARASLWPLHESRRTGSGSHFDCFGRTEGILY